MHWNNLNQSQCGERRDWRVNLWRDRIDKDGWG
jgi:hypothetical protein